VVIATKLRRSESFTVSWRHPDDQPRGRSTIWLHPSIPLRFVFDTADPPELSRSWIAELANSANSSGGIMLTPEQLDTGSGPVLDVHGEPHPVPNLNIEELNIGKVTVSGADSTGKFPLSPTSTP
jgi:hypothetical protein